jgi:Ca-activated chloride channel family protein
VCLDTSRSMLAQDLRPSRLERAKREVVGLLDLLRGDRVALVAFSGDARDVAPLTRDKGTLAGLLAHVSPDDNREGGTDLAAAIEHALALFDGRTGAHEAIVLLTDGEDLAGEGAKQAEEARKRGIRIFVVGVGTEAGGKIPVMEGGKAAFLRDPDGNEVVTKLERASLERLARSTGGEFLSAEQSPTPLEDLYRARVARIEGREIESGERRVPYDRYQWPLALGLLCLLAELGLGDRRRVRAAQADGATRLAAAFLPFLALGGQESSAARAPSAPGPALAAAERSFDAGDLAAAEEAAQRLLEHAGALSDDVRARAHFALGVIAATRALENPEEGEPLRQAARDALHAARALAGPGTLRADATYDLGTLELLHAEEVRATLPELGGSAVPPGAQALQGLPPAAAPPGAQGEEQTDPLDEARALYREARTWLVERLRLDWQDADTRANLELVQRRLRELDEIEEQREEQQQEQEQQQDPQSGDEPKDPQDGDEKQESEEPQDSEEQGDPEQEPQPGEPEDGEQEPKEPEPPTDPQEGEPQEPEPQEGTPQAAEPPEERVLTREEVMQLLDKLAELEAQQRALEAALRARTRAATKRDW